jgi:hypothetical protein
MRRGKSFTEIAKTRGAYLARWRFEYRYENGTKTNDVIGIRYYVSIPVLGYRLVPVVVSNTTPIMSHEDLSTSIEVADIEVTFDSFEGYWYKHNDQWEITCTAENIRLKQ